MEGVGAESTWSAGKQYKTHRPTQSILKMLFCRRIISRTTLTLFTVLVMQVVMCLGEAKVLIPPQNQTLPLGSVAEFTCQVRGHEAKVRINGTLFYEHEQLSYSKIEGITVTSVTSCIDENDLPIINMTITVEATVWLNNTLITCVVVEQFQDQETAIIIVQGAPATPKVQQEVISQTDFSLSWSSPFTWKEYPIIGYHARCVNLTNQYMTKVLFDRTLSNTTFSYSHVIPDGKAACSKIKCSVTANNSLAESEGSNVIVEIPMGTPPSLPEISVDKIRFSANKVPEVTFCVKLPLRCMFEEAKYSIIIISNTNGLENSIVYNYTINYANGYKGDCLMLVIETGLIHSTEYTATVYFKSALYAEKSKEPYSFKPQLSDGTQGITSNNDSNDFLSTTSGLVTVILITIIIVMIAIVSIMISVTIVIRKKKSKQCSEAKPPLKRTLTPMVTNPIYSEERGPVYEFIPENLRPPALHTQASYTSQSNLDSPQGRIHSPTHSNGSRPSSPSYRLNNAISPYSKNAFIFPYGVVQPTNPATFDSINASVQNVTRIPEQTQSHGQLVPQGAPGEESYITMHQVDKTKTQNVESGTFQPHYAVDMHGNQYIEC